MIEDFGFTQKFKSVLPDVYERWKNVKEDFASFFEDRKASADCSGVVTVEVKRASVRKAFWLNLIFQGAIDVSQRT